MKFKKLTAAVSAVVLAASAVIPCMNSITASAGDYNYAEALQKSMFFYEVQQSGKLPDWNMVTWRADSMVNEDGKETDFVPGGWFDAGDHFKFALTNAYSASLMAWGYIEYADALKKAGLDELYLQNIKWGLDYVKGCDQGGGKVVGTIGDFKGGSTDHNIWCSAEVYLRKHHLNGGDWDRPYDVIENASVAGLCAAALAQGYIIFKDESYLTHAKDLFKGADAIRACKDIGGMTGMYNSSSWLDDCMYAACWLYKATGDKSYLDKIEKDYIPNFPLEEQSTSRKYTWGLCWDDTSQAAAFLYAQITEDKEWIEHVSHHLDYWIDGYGGKKVDYTPDGLAWLFNWGCLRHATTTAWLAKLASDTLFKGDSTLARKYDDWAKSQMDYCFGDNALKLSYVLGMGDKNPTAVHHRTASGIHDDHWNELGKTPTKGSEESWQTEYAHTLYGALIGGPDKSGGYDMAKIGVSDYQYSEVAIDYNAGYTACLCAMIDDYGGSTLADFPPAETPTWDEWQVAAVLNGSGASYTELKMWAMNHTAWPARVQKDIEVRYFFDVSEVIDAGLSVDDIKVEGKSQQYGAGEQGYATVSGPYKYSDNIYYASIKFEDGRAIQPTGQSEHRDEVQFRISVPDAIEGKPTTGAWDASNDPSFEGVAEAKSLKTADSLNKHITMYVNGELCWGVEPDGTEAKPLADIGGKPGKEISGTDVSRVTTATTQETTSTTASATETSAAADSTVQNNEGRTPGDVNLDKQITVSDAILIARIAAEDSTVKVADKGMANASVDGKDGVTVDDVTQILKFLAGIILEKDLL
ncbi:MAG: glycoside hydrolase family 9 protein [Oscillospiraceae bacterium]|nr:glycoside hydrolase family 9 protein [Oscillospiraceae bacterium]